MLPLDTYREQNEHNGNNAPEKVPEPAPIGGVDVRCGPILRLCSTHEDRNSPNYRASLMIVVKGLNDESIPKISYEVAGSGFSGEFSGKIFHTVKDYSFIRYSINFLLHEEEQTIKYAINDEHKPQFVFFIPGKDQSMNIVSYSCNGFSLSVDPSDFKSSLWYDVLKNHEKQHYHVMLGGGDQIYADAITLQSEKLKVWLNEKSPSKKSSMKTDEATRQEFHDFYLDHYLAWFGQGFWKGPAGTTLQGLFPTAMATIPSVNIYDDHDIIDGFGSYKDSTMAQDYFSNIGKIAYEYYMLFQHQVSINEPAHNDTKEEGQWILSPTKGRFIQQYSHSNYVRLGKEIAFTGFDCRTERKLKQIIPEETYDAIFTRLKREIENAPDVKHLLVMLGVPIMYPRLTWLEWLLTSPIMKPARFLAIKGVINKGLVNSFDGSVEVLDDLNDHWCSRHHKKERNYLLKRLSDFGAEHGVRITILSGDVHLGCVSRLKSKIHHSPETHIITGSNELKQHNENVLDFPEKDPRLIFNVISSAIVNTPPPDAMATLLYKRSGIHHYNNVTDEDVLPLFLTNPDGSLRENQQFLNKRNWCDLILAKQSIYKDETNKNLRKFPGPLSKQGKELIDKLKSDSTHCKYPLESNSLVTTLHIEDKTDDYDCNTALYEVLIPELQGRYKIESPGIKHL